MGELAGGGGEGGRGGECQGGEDFLVLSPDWVLSQQHICAVGQSVFMTWVLNTTMPRKSEARPRGQTHPVKPDPEAQGRPRRWTQLTREHNGLGSSFNTTGTVTPVTLTPGMTLGGHMPPPCLSLLTWRMKVMGVKL